MSDRDVAFLWFGACIGVCFMVAVVRKGRAESGRVWKLEETAEMRENRAKFKAERQAAEDDFIARIVEAIKS